MTTIHLDPFPRLGDLLAAGAKPPDGDIWSRTDGHRLFYRGLVNGLWGQPESGKTLLVQHVATEFMRDGGKVLYIDFEMGEYFVAGRFGMVGASPTLLNENLLYRDNFTSEDMDSHLLYLESLIDAGEECMIVVDSMDTLLEAYGINPNDQQAGTTINRLLFQRTRKIGVTVVIIDHVSTSKAPAKDRGAMGSTQKLSEVDLGMKVLATAMPVRGGRGKLTLILDKDRHGGVRQYCAPPGESGVWRAGVAHVSSEVDPSKVEIWVEPPVVSVTVARMAHWEIVVRHLLAGPATKEELNQAIQSEDPTSSASDPLKSVKTRLREMAPVTVFEWIPSAGHYELTTEGEAWVSETLRDSAGAPSGAEEKMEF